MGPLQAGQDGADRGRLAAARRRRLPARPGEEVVGAPSLLRRLRTGRAILRSLVLYYGDPARRRAMDGLLGGLVRPGDLVFDVGSHVGDRTLSFRRLGARVVAVEPHPALVKLLRLLYGRDAAVAIEAVAVAAAPGTVALRIARGNLMVSTASPEFEAAARDAPLWRDVRWEETVAAEATTLDALIARHGVPSF